MRSSAMRGVAAVGSSMRAWVTEQYKAPLVLREIPIPQISSPNHVLVKVKAASMNPIDTRMATGYGDEVLSTFRQVENCSLDRPARLPLIAGRDCAGEVVAVGSDVRNVSVGDEVMAVVPGHWQGAHAEYVLTKSIGVTRKPSSVDYIQATTLPYVACTSWAALVSVAQVNPENASGLRALIHGGSGGMGSAAIQMLKAWGAEKVVATASARNLDYVNALGGIGVDYNDPEVKDRLIAEGPFDVVLSCVDTDLSRWSDNIMGIWRNSVHVSVISPMLRDTDRYGLPMGMVSTALKYFERSAGSAVNGRWFSYAYFLPNQDAMEQLRDFIDAGKVKIPAIDNVYKFIDAPLAYARCAQLHTRGKLVIDVAGTKVM